MLQKWATGNVPRKEKGHTLRGPGNEVQARQAAASVKNSSKQQGAVLESRLWGIAESQTWAIDKDLFRQADEKIQSVLAVAKLSPEEY